MRPALLASALALATLAPLPLQAQTLTLEITTRSRATVKYVSPVAREQKELIDNKLIVEVKNGKSTIRTENTPNSHAQARDVIVTRLNRMGPNNSIQALLRTKTHTVLSMIIIDGSSCRHSSEYRLLPGQKYFTLSANDDGNALLASSIRHEPISCTVRHISPPAR